MKYLVLIADGMSDEGKNTPLEVAKTPNLDYLARHGTCGWVSNVPSGMEPGSDVAAMSILGYNPKKFYTGRGPLEAASLGVKLKKDEVCFRCNLVAVKDGKMESFTAHQIKTETADGIIKMLNREFGSASCRFYTGLSYRHLCVIKKKELVKVKTVPPHDITGKPIKKYLPKNKFIREMMLESQSILKDKQANMIWLWGQGVAPSIKKFPKKGAIITAVHLLKGLGKLAGLSVVNVPGATGYLDTNYKGKAEYALDALKTREVVFVHVEAPDEAGHEGDFKHKVQAIEDFDKLVVGTILESIRLSEYQNIRILVLADHPTPVKKMTHTMDPVPFVIYGPKEIAGRIKKFSEKELKRAKIRIREGYKLLSGQLFLHNK